MNIKAKSTFERRMMAFFMISALALFVSVGVLFFLSTKPIIEASKEHELTTLAGETGNKIERFLFERYGDIEVMAQSPLLKNKEISAAVKSSYLDSVRNAYKTYDYILITDKDGRTVVSSGDLQGDTTYQKWLSLKSNPVFVSDFIETKDKTYVLYFIANILDANGQVMGTVIERMNTKAITDIIKNVYSGENGYAYLMNNQGEQMLYPKRGDVPKFNLDATINYSVMGGETTVSALKPIEKYSSQRNNWYIVVQEPVREAFAVNYRLRNYTIALIVISLLILFSLAAVISKMLTKPIKRLVAEAQEMVEGGFTQGVEVNVNGEDEIGSLAQSFNALLSNLKSTIQKVLELSGEAASLHEIRQYADKFFDNVPGAIITLDNAGKITTFNSVAANITGIPRCDLVGKDVEILENSGMRDFAMVLQDSLKKEAVYIKHIVQIERQSQGDVIPIMMSTSIQKDHSGKTMGIIGVFRSVIEIKKFEESVLRAKNLSALGSLSAGVAHEIRNPLTSITGYAQYIRSELGTQHELAPDVSVIINEVDRLNGIIDRFLSFARPDQPDLKPVDINGLINTVLILLQKEGFPGNVSLMTELISIPDLMIDFDQMEQVLLNLILNALQAMPDGGMLGISTRLGDNTKMAEIEITDTGVGIAPEHYDQIFEPFFSTKNKGTGLGLAISARIVENHQGFIDVLSSPGVGTKFVIRLPLSQS